MGKANRLKTEKAENTLTSSTYKKKSSKGMPTWVGTTIVVTVLAVVLLTAAFFALSGAGTFNRMRVVMKTDNFKVTVPMMSYTIYTTYQNEVASYEEMSKNWGVTITVPTGSGGDKLDTNKPIRDQIYATTDKDTKLPLEAPVTWFDHYATQAMEDVKKMLVVCEAAKAAGVKLEDGEKESIDMAIQYLALYASYYGYTTSGYISTMYGEGVSEKDVRAMMEISALSDKYNKIRSEEFTAGVTDEQVKAEYDGNTVKYDVFVDYIAHTFSANFTPSTKTDAAAAKEENEKNAAKYEAKKAKYDAILKELEEAAKNDPTNYGKKLLAVLQELYLDEEKEAALAKKEEGATLSAEELDACKKTADKKAEDAVIEAVSKNIDTSASTVDTAFKAWVTDKNSPKKSGDVYVNANKYDAFNEPEDRPEEDEPGADATEKDYMSSSSTFSIYLLTSPLKCNDGTLRSVGHILFQDSTFTDTKTNKLMTTSDSFSGVMKTLADRVLKKQSELTAKAMAAELIALMIEEGKMTEKTENGKTFYAMDPAVFEAYGKQYTSDTGGVLYDNVKQNQMVKKFENWLFDDSRVVGEVSSEAVETSYGYHIMLYRGDEKPAWSYAIRVSLAEGRYDAWMEQILKDTPVVEKAQNLDHVA
jgi:hypothetical protein